MSYSVKRGLRICVGPEPPCPQIHAYPALLCSVLQGADLSGYYSQAPESAGF